MIMTKHPRIQQIMDMLYQSNIYPSDKKRYTTSSICGIMEDDYGVTVDKDDYKLMSCLIPFFNKKVKFVSDFKACGIFAVWGDDRRDLYIGKPSIFLKHSTKNIFVKYSVKIKIDILKYGIIDATMNAFNDLSSNKIIRADWVWDFHLKHLRKNKRLSNKPWIPSQPCPWLLNTSGNSAGLIPSYTKSTIVTFQSKGRGMRGSKVKTLPKMVGVI